MTDGESEAWQSTTLGAACNINPSRPKLDALSDDTPVTFLPMAAVDAVSGTVTRAESRKLSEVRTKSYRTFVPGDVLFAKITPCMENGKSAVAPEMSGGLGFGSTEFHILRPRSGVNPRFIWHYIRQEHFRDLAEEQMSGSVGQLRVPVTFLETFPFDLPGKELQDVIVKILDLATDSAHSAASHLAKARAAVERFRQSVLAAACSGRLTADWRAGKASLARADLVDRRAEFDAVDAPDEWPVVTVAEIGYVQLGGTPSRKVASYWSGEVPWVSSGEVANCRIRRTRECISKDGLAKSSAKIYPAGTVLIAMIGEGKTRGQAAILDIEATTNQNAAGVSPDRKFIDPEYLWRWAVAQYEVTRAVGRGGNQPALNKQKVQELAIAIPSLEEQAEIVRRVDQLLSSTDNLTARVGAAARRIERSSQAILAKAFRGDLSPAVESTVS